MRFLQIVLHLLVLGPVFKMIKSFLTPANMRAICYMLIVYIENLMFILKVIIHTKKYWSKSEVAPLRPYKRLQAIILLWSDVDSKWDSQSLWEIVLLTAGIKPATRLWRSWYCYSWITAERFFGTLTYTKWNLLKQVAVIFIKIMQQKTINHLQQMFHNMSA